MEGVWNPLCLLAPSAGLQAPVMHDVIYYIIRMAGHELAPKQLEQDQSSSDRACSLSSTAAFVRYEVPVPCNQASLMHLITTSKSVQHQCRQAKAGRRRLGSFKVGQRRDRRGGRSTLPNLRSYRNCEAEVKARNGRLVGQARAMSARVRVPLAPSCQATRGQPGTASPRATTAAPWQRTP